MSKLNVQLSSGSQISGGKVAFSADGDTVLWRTGSNGVQVSQYTNSFTTVSSLPSTAAIASDKLNNSIFYGAASSSFYLSTDGGKTFSAKGSLGTSTSPVKIVVNPSVTGDVWVSTDKGLFHSTNLGASFSAISGMSQAWAIALGAPASVRVTCILRVRCSRQYRLAVIPLCSLLPTTGELGISGPTMPA